MLAPTKKARSALKSARFRRRDHVAINAPWVGVRFQHPALMSIIPFAGVLSDRLRRRVGDRRVQTPFALAIDAVALLAMACVSSIVNLGAATIIAIVALTSGSVVYELLVPEIVARGHYRAAVIRCEVNLAPR